MARATAGSGSNGHQNASLGELLALELPFEDVPLPEYGDKSLRLFAVSGKERQRLGQISRAAGDELDKLAFQIEVVAAAAHEKTESIAELPSSVIDRLSDVALRLTGFAPDEAEQALKATPSGDSG